VVALLIVSHVAASPFETQSVWDNFAETAELLLGFSPSLTSKEFKLVKNGMSFEAHEVLHEPLIGSLCGVSPSQNLSMVLITTDGVLMQRALYVVGNILPNSTEAAGIVKLRYEPPKADRSLHHIVVLFEMANYIPRFTPGDCTTNSGQELRSVCDEMGDCKPQWVDSRACVAWQALPGEKERNQFDLKTFAASNNLTAVDILWFTVFNASEPAGDSDDTHMHATAALLSTSATTGVSVGVTLPAVVTDANSLQPSFDGSVNPVPGTTSNVAAEESVMRWQGSMGECLQRISV